MNQFNININGRECLANPGQTILEVALENHIDIPTLCHDRRVQTYGACGLCVVEIEGNSKLLRACATEVAPKMVIITESERISSSRKIALELLLSDHTGDCRPPCVLKCPGLTDCQGYVGLIANGEFKEALKLIKEQLPLPASIGRVCPHPCEEACRRELRDEPISIAWHKRFVADLDLSDPFIPEIKPSSGKTVGIVGGGPGGLTAAYYLAQEGHAVTIFDMMPEMGGMLKYGIPQYRLPKEVLNQEIDIIKKMGVVMKNNVRIGRDTNMDHLRSAFDAVYLSPGCWESIALSCPGEDLEGVYGGINFLANVVQNKPMKIGKRVAVIGGGNTAMDACRTAIRLGAEKVYNLYRRTRDEMPAEQVEIIESEEEGVDFRYLVAPIEVVGNDGKVSGIRLQKMKLGEPDASGRRRPIAIQGDEELLDLDSVIVAIGQNVNIQGFEEFDRTKWNTIISDTRSFSTSIPGVFAGGDAINDNNKIAIQAIGDAKIASKAIHSYLQGLNLGYEKPYLVTREDVKEDEFTHRPKANRPHMKHLSPDERRGNFNEIVAGYSPLQAIEDAKRCLECGCHDYFECKLIKYSTDYHVHPERLMGELHRRKIPNNHPFIDRNPDKCILCGLCVRVCSEVMGVTALGLVDRGFDTIVKPAMDKPLENTDCISCGQCVSVCPTGALQEKLQIEKSVPLETTSTKTICSFCSIGCHIDLQTRGNMIVRALPDKDSPVDHGLLCVKGRFAYPFLQAKDRALDPMIRKNGELVPVGWSEALQYVAKKVQGLALQHGYDTTALAIGASLTTHEMYLAQQLGHEVFRTPWVTSFGLPEAGISEVLGLDASPNTLDELCATDVIIVIGANPYQHHTIAAIKIKEAVKAGAKLITINPCSTLLDEWAILKELTEKQINFLKEIASALVSMGATPKNVQGWDAFKEDLKSVSVGENARQIAEIYYKAKSAMIVFDQHEVSPDTAKMIANLALISGHIGKPRRGIIQLKAQCNSQALPLVGIIAQKQKVLKALDEGKIKSLLVFGENFPDLKLNNLDFLMVMDSHLTETAQMADVFLPMASFAESQGIYISTDRRVQALTQAFIPASGMENWQIIQELSLKLKAYPKSKSFREICMEMEQKLPGFLGLNPILNQSTFWPAGQNPVLYTHGFAFEDKQARMIPVADGPLFLSYPLTHSATQKFLNFLEEAGLKRS
jgi:formate dehydrogenase major subunit